MIHNKLHNFLQIKRPLHNLQQSYVPWLAEGQLAFKTLIATATLLDYVTSNQPFHIFAHQIRHASSDTNIHNLQLGYDLVFKRQMPQDLFSRQGTNPTGSFFFIELPILNAKFDRRYVHKAISNATMPITTLLLCWPSGVTVGTYNSVQGPTIRHVCTQGATLPTVSNLNKRVNSSG